MATVSQECIVKYHVINSAEKSFVVAADVYGYISESFDVSYQLTDHLVTTPFGIAYDVRNTVDQDWNGGYTIYNGASREFVGAYGFREKIQQSFKVEYLFGNYAYRPLQVSYSTPQPIKVKSTAFKVYYVYTPFIPVTGMSLAVSYHKYADRLGPLQVNYSFVKSISQQNSIAYDVMPALLSQPLKVCYNTRMQESEVRAKYPAMIPYDRIYTV